MSFSRYPEYKNSDIEWLEPIPINWDIKKLKHICSIFPSNVDKKSYENEIQIKLCNYTDVYYNQKIVAEMDFMVATATLDQIDKFTLRKGDVIITKDSESADDIGIPAYIPENIPGVVCGYHLSIIRPTKNSFGLYLKYLFDSDYIKAILETSANGLTRVGLSQYALDNIEIPCPAFEEQVLISEFIDKEISKIDNLVIEQEKLIQLLKEKRVAVISHAVTKGINPMARMKDSGVNWLGQVPEHWEVRSLKHIVATPITDGPHETPEFLDEGVPFVSAEAVSSGIIDFQKIRGFISRRSHEKYSMKYQPKIGDIYMVKSGATTGVCAIVETDMEFNIWSPLAAIRCNEVMEPYFVLNFMRSINFQEAVTLNWSFGTQQNIGMGVIENLQLPTPPKHEQHQIANHLDKINKETDSLLDEVVRAIALLKERRSALITAAVTGQIDVRNFVSKLETS